MTSPHLWNTGFIFLCLTIFLAYLQQGLLIPTLPLYVDAFGGSAVLAGLVLAAFSVTSFGLRPFVGYSVDRWRPLRILSFGTLLLAVCGVALALPLFPVLVVANAVRGLGWASMNTAGYTVLVQVSPVTRRGEASGYYTLVTAVAHAVGPPVALWLLAPPLGAFTSVFVLAGSTALLATASVQLVARAAPRPEAGPGHQAGRGAERIELAAFVDRGVLLASALLVCMTVTTPAASAFLPLYARELGIDNAGAYFVASGVVNVLSRVALGRYLDRGARSTWIALGFGLMVAGLALVAGAAGIGLLIAGGALFSLGNAIANPMLLALAIDLADPRRPGAAMATFSASYQMGGAIGAPAAGLLIEGFGYGGMYMGSIAALLIGLLLTAASWQRLQAAQLTASATGSR